MNKLTLVYALFVCLIIPAVTKSMPVFGEDDRFAISGGSDARLRGLADSTAALIRKEAIGPSGELSAKSVGEAHHLCPGENYYNEPSAALCSGVLIAKNMILTAGHCVKHCLEMRIVFGYSEYGGGTAHIPPSETYECKSAWAGEEENMRTDIGFVLLDREVTNHQPANTSFIEAKTGLSVIVIGHSMGMPQKAQTNASIIATSQKMNFFMTDADAEGGQSGSPVFDAGTGKLLGIINKQISEEGDFEYDEKGKCYKLTRLPLNCKFPNMDYYSIEEREPNLEFQAITTKDEKDQYVLPAGIGAAMLPRTPVGSLFIP